MKRLRIFITGSSGFIGRNILENLGNKYDFLAPSHKDLDLLDTEAVDSFFKKNGVFDVVVHSAFIGGPRSFVDTPATLDDNLRIFFNIVRNQKSFKKLLNLGSGAEYGKQRALVNVSEDDFDAVLPLKTDYYGFAKYIIAKYIENSDNLINLRLFGVWGKYEDLSLRFISNTICKYILGMPLTVKRNVYFEYLYINDFVKIFDYFLTHRVGYKSYNVGRSKPIDLITIVNKINQIAKYKCPVKVKPRGLANEYTCNNSRLMSELKNFKFSDFDDSLKELYGLYLKKKSMLKRKDLAYDP